MLFFDLLPRLKHRRGALRGLCLRHRLRVPVILLFDHHGPVAPRLPVGQRDRDQQFRFAVQHSGQPAAD